MEEIELGIPGVQPEVVIRLSWADFLLLVGSPFLPAVEVPGGGFTLPRDERAEERRAELCRRLADRAGDILSRRTGL